MEKVRIIQKPVVEGLPTGHSVLFFGKIDEEDYFVIHQPSDGSARTNIAYLNRGWPGNLKEKGECRFQAVHDKFEFIKVEIPTGTFIFPTNDSFEVEKRGEPRPATFNGQPIEVYGD